MFSARTIVHTLASTLLVLTVAAGCAVPPPPAGTPSTVPLARPAAGDAATPVAGPTVTPAGFSDYERSALRVRNIGCGGVASGSGFAIADHVFITNRHVIGGAAVLQVSTYDGHDIDVAATGAVAFADLALVWTREPLPQTLKLAASNPVVGASVTAIGFPLGGPLTTTRGKVLGYAQDPIGWSSLPMLVNDAPIDHGSSGSPLIDDAGHLVGVVYAGGPSQYAVPVEVLKKVLAKPDAYSHTAACDGVLNGPGS
jgi:S1-C subfamily serine protease